MSLRDVEHLFRYIMLRFETLHETVRQLVPETEEALMTIEEQLRAEGEAKARIHALKKLMTLKFGSLSAEHATRIEATTEQQLDLYIERILSASTADEVFASEV